MLSLLLTKSEDSHTDMDENESIPDARIDVVKTFYGEIEFVNEKVIARKCNECNHVINGTDTSNSLIFRIHFHR